MPKLIVFADESIREGEFYSNFFGASIINERIIDKTLADLKQKKSSFGLNGEIKWTNINPHNKENYIKLMQYFFKEYVAKDLIKIRIFFTHNCYEYKGVVLSDKETYFKLYYQFLKHGLGFQWSSYSDIVDLRFYLDRIPYRGADRYAFKEFISKFPNNLNGETTINIDISNITEIDSKKHLLLQMTDIILGSIQFKLNDKHKKRNPDGRIPKITTAKLEVYREINKSIRNIYPNFNIGSTTGKQGDIKNLWNHPYRHWKFVPNEHEYKKELAKSKHKK